MDTVVIEDDCQNSEATPNIIEIDDEGDDDIVEIVDIEEIAQSNILDFEQFLQQCFAQDCSPAMMRVINRTLIPLYRINNSKFRNDLDTETFGNALKRALHNVKIDPVHRFSHIKELCEILKYLKNKIKAPVPVPVPVAKKKNKHIGKKRSKSSKRKHGKRPRIVGNVINIDDDIDDEFEVQILNSNAADNCKEADGKENVETIPNSHPVNGNYIEIEVPQLNLNVEDVSNTGNTQSYVETAGKVTDYSPEITEVHSLGVSQNLKDNNIQGNQCLLQTTRSNPTKANHLTSGPCVVTNTALYEKYMTNYTPNQSPGIIRQNLTEAEIEKQIEIFKKLVDKYSVEEVIVDSQYSPYLQCEYFQKKIVMLYQRLCELKGRPFVKRREVRLRAIDSRPELPIKKLENLINSNIGYDGLPHFPDLEEVTDCVREANAEGNLGWDTKRIMDEARGLFVHCGKALQSKRQKREWRDLMSMVKDDSLADPADSDPILAARLHMNKLIAKSREFDVLENKRQKREWCDLMSMVKDDSLADPADSDPILAARLHMNKLIAKSREFDVLEKYTNLEYTLRGTSNGMTDDIALPDVPDVDQLHNHTINNNHGDDYNVSQIRIESVSSGEQVVRNEKTNNVTTNCDAPSRENNNRKEVESLNHEIPPVENSNKTSTDNANKNTSEDSIDLPEFNSKSIQVVSIETFDDFDTCNDGNVTSNHENSSKDDNSNKNNETVNPIQITQIYFVNMNNVTNNYVNIETLQVNQPVNAENLNSCNTPATNTSEKERPNVLQVKRKTADGTMVIDHSAERREAVKQSAPSEEQKTNEETNHGLFSADTLGSEVKSENAIRELNELGHDFTVKILNIIDPFLIVEISSDSSEDEGD